MGLTDSPCRSIQTMIRLKMYVYGDKTDIANPFHWLTVQLNFPGKKGHRSDLPWMMKICWDGHLACEGFLYVDDGRATGFCREICWAAAWRVASLCTKYGVQDKAAKRTFLSHLPEPWAGTISRTDQGEVVGLVCKEKWAKTRGLVQELALMLNDASEKGQQGPPLVEAMQSPIGRWFYRWCIGGMATYHRWHVLPERRLPRKRLLKIWGFLNYVVRTYPWLNPYTKGLHLTIDS